MDLHTQHRSMVGAKEAEADDTSASETAIRLMHSLHSSDQCTVALVLRYMTPWHSCQPESRLQQKTCCIVRISPDVEVSMHCKNGVFHKSYFAQHLLAPMAWPGMQNSGEISSGISKIEAPTMISFSLLVSVYSCQSMLSSAKCSIIDCNKRVNCMSHQGFMHLLQQLHAKQYQQLLGSTQNCQQLC